MARPREIFEEWIGPKKPIPTDTAAEVARVSARTVSKWGAEDEKVEPDYSDCQHLFASPLIPQGFKLAMLNDLLRGCGDVRAVPCGGEAKADGSSPLRLSTGVIAELVEIQEIIQEAQGTRSPAGTSFSVCESNALATPRVRAEMKWQKMWTEIERRTMRRQDKTA